MVIHLLETLVNSSDGWLLLKGEDCSYNQCMVMWVSGY